MGPRLHRTICRVFSASVWTSVPSLRATLWGCPVPRPSLPSQAKPEPRCLVKRILAQFPAGRKRFYKMGSPFPTGRKSGVTGDLWGARGYTSTTSELFGPWALRCTEGDKVCSEYTGIRPGPTCLLDRSRIFEAHAARRGGADREWRLPAAASGRGR